MTRRGRAGLRVLATVMVAVAIAVIAGAVRDQDDAAAVPAPGPGPAESPLLSARRVPYVFSDAVARERLAAGLDGFASQYDTCVAVDETAGDDTPIVDLRHDLLLAPASNMKLLTAAAALTTFDEDHRFVTRAAVDDTGNLYLIGGGDSLLGSGAFEEELHAVPRNATTPVTRIEPLADAVVAAGIGPVTAIVADDTRHDDLRFLPEWKASYRDDVGPLGALTVNGGRADGAPVADPARFAAEQFASLLTQRGVTVGTVTTGRAPEGAREIAAVASPVVGDVVAAMLTSSDNLTAELLTREIGLARGGDGTTAAGTAAIIAALEPLGVPTTGLVVHDGSGLAPTSRVTCAALLATLRLDDPRFAALDRGLPVAGRTGTLVARFQGDALEGVLRAKTGRIDGAVALSGTVDDAEHLRFAFVANGDFSSARGEALQAEVARLVAAYPDAPNPAEIVPSP